MKFSIPAILSVLIIMAVACQSPQTNDANAQKSEEPATDGVFIHITKGPDHPHQVLMALQMAVMMAETQDVLVYLDIEAVHVVTKDSKDLAYSHFPTSHSQINKLVEMGVPVMACPGCLKAAEKTAEDLLEGVQVADKETFFNFTEGRILTLDY